MKNYIFPIFFFLVLQQFSIAQGLGFNWAQRFGGTGTDYFSAITKDVAGNVYITGIANGAYFTKKMSPTGGTLWNLAIPAEQITVDAFLNVYIVASFYASVDADPGPGVLTFTAIAGGWDILVSKLNANGNLIWAKHIEGTGYDIGSAIATDPGGNVYTSGSFTDIIDFDPGLGVSSFTALVSQRHGYLTKMDPNGNFLWTRQFKGNSEVQAYTMTVDNFSNLYLAGIFTGSVDLDPGPAVDTHTSTSINDRDAFICKFDLNGNLAWVREIGNSDNNGLSTPAIDKTGNILLTASYSGSLDVDPGPAVLNFTTFSAIDRDFFISEWNPSGNLVWAIPFTSSGDAGAAAIKLDSLDNIYMAGSFTGTMDFDPGPGSANITAAGATDMFIGKWSSTGVFKWGQKIGGTGTEYPYDLVLDQYYNVYIAGLFNSVVDFDPGTAITNLTSFGNNDVFVAKYCTRPDQPIAILGNVNICMGASGMFSIAALPNTQTYNWTLPTGWIGSGNSSSITVTAGANGLVSVSAANACGTGAALTLSVTAVPLISLSASQNTFCAGSQVTLTAGGAATYLWSNAMTGNAITVSPSASSVYTVTGTTAAGCSSIATQLVTVDICAGLNEAELQAGFMMYPNPSSGTIKIISDKTGIITIVSTSGLTISSALHKDKVSVLDLSGLVEGVYFVHFGSSTQPQKLLLVK